MQELSLFLQFEGSRSIELISVASDARVDDIVAAAVQAGYPSEHREAAFVFIDILEEPLERGRPVCDQGASHKGRVHVHRCRRIETAVTFNQFHHHHEFAPATKVERVKRWFVDKIGMNAVDATEHVLQIAGTNDRPDPDLHIGSLVEHACALHFTLVPRKRVEG